MNWLLDKVMDNYYVVLGGIVVTLVPTAIYLSVQEQKAWNEFAKTHECKLIAHQSGYTAYGYSTSGKYGSYWVPSRDTYHCNDGIDYTR